LKRAALVKVVSAGSEKAILDALDDEHLFAEMTEVTKALRRGLEHGIISPLQLVDDALQYPAITACTGSASTVPLGGTCASTRSPTRSASIGISPPGVATSVPATKHVHPPSRSACCPRASSATMRSLILYHYL